MSLLSASNGSDQVIASIILLVLLCALHLLFYFGIVDSLPMPPLVGALFIDRFFKSIFQLKPFIAPIPFQLVTTLPEYTLLSNLWVVLQTNLEVNINTANRHNSHYRKSLFLFAKCVVIMPNTKVSLSVKTISTKLYLEDITFNFNANPNGLDDRMD